MKGQEGRAGQQRQKHEQKHTKPLKGHAQSWPQSLPHTLETNKLKATPIGGVGKSGVL